MSVNEFLTLIIALYGAIIATILGISELRKDRTRISIVIEHLTFYERIQITIINIGHRPVTISEIGMATNMNPNGKEAWEGVPRNALFDTREEPFPITLADGEHVTLLLSSVFDPNLFVDNGKHVRISVYDVNGNVYTKFKTRIHDPKWGHYDKMRK